MTPADERRIAEAADQSEWKFPHAYFPGVVVAKRGCLWNPGTGRINDDKDAEFIATFNPKRVLELLDEVDRLRGHCHCDKNPATTNGPEEDCPQHGRPYEYWVEAVGTLEARLAEHEQAVENMSTKTDDLLSKLAAVEKLHQPVEAVAATGATITVCRRCAGDFSHVFDGQANYPCPTIKAVRGE